MLIHVVYNLNYSFFFYLGFYIRKYIFNYYSRKRYLEGVLAKNEIVR